MKRAACLATLLVLFTSQIATADDNNKVTAALQSYFRDYTDNEMWKLCLNRNSDPGSYVGRCACALLASPNPWRPVETPAHAEKDDARF